MDHHVPLAITEGLRLRGVDVLTAAEDGTAEVDDEQLLARASDLGRPLFSQDDDLLVVAKRWLNDDREFAGLIYGHQLATTIGQAVRDLEIIVTVLNPVDMRNRVEFLPL